MRKFSRRGKRIRSTDKDLVFRFAAVSLLPVFLGIILFMNLKDLCFLGWKGILLASGECISPDLPHLVFSIFVAAFTCLALALLFRSRYPDYVQHLFHRQKLARMIFENGWYESEQSQSDGFFKDLSSNRKAESIRHFPKMYYLLEDGKIHVQIEITMGKYQEQLLHLEKKLESGLYCELISKELKDSFVEYTLLYDMIACINRFYADMVQRSEDMKTMPNYKTGENYAYLSLPARFLIFDEYVTFMEMLGTKENVDLLNKLKQIKGRGYVDTGINVISEFYTPLVPKDHDFLNEIGSITSSKQAAQAACEAKAPQA